MFREYRCEKGHLGAESFPLHAAIRRENRVVIQPGTNAGLMDCMDQDGNTPLHLAVERGYCKWVDYMLVNKADVNIVNKFGMTPLLLAVRHCHPHLVLLLLSHDANPHFVNPSGQTAIHYACCAGDKMSMHYLLQSNVKVNLQDADGVTPLIMACRMKKTAMLQQLLAHKTVAKANPNLCDKLGRSPLHWVAEVGEPACARTLIAAHADLNATDADLETPFVRAIKKNNLPVLDVLMEAGCDRFNIDGLNGTAMTMSALLGRTEVMERLLGEGDDPDEFGNIGFTPLTAAVFESHVDTVRLLLDKGADPNRSARMGSTPLVMATCFLKPCTIDARHKITKMLLQANADANLRVTMAGFFTHVTRGRNCPMSFALTAGCTSMAQMHLIAGCRVTLSEVKEWEEIGNFECDRVVKMMYDWAMNVRPLKFLCRQVIRAQLRSQVHHELEELPLPPAIIAYLRFNDMDNIKSTFYEMCGGVRKEAFMHSRSPCGLRGLMGTLSYEMLGAPAYST